MKEKIEIDIENLTEKLTISNIVRPIMLNEKNEFMYLDTISNEFVNYEPEM